MKYWLRSRNIYLLTFSDSFMHEILSCHDSGLVFPKTPQQLPKISDDFAKTPNVAENVWRIFRWSLRTFKAIFKKSKNSTSRTWIYFLQKSNWIFVMNHVLKNNLSGFVSQVGEIDAWDRCLWSKGVRLTHDACVRAGRYSNKAEEWANKKSP